MKTEHVPIGSVRVELVEKITPCVAPFTSVVELVYVTAGGEACVRFTSLRLRQRLRGVVHQSDKRARMLNMGAEPDAPCNPPSGVLST